MFAQKGSRKETKIPEFTYRDAMNVVHGTYDHTGTNWSHWNSKKSFKEKSGSHTRKHSTDSPQKAVIFGTSHIIRKVLQCEA